MKTKLVIKTYARMLVTGKIEWEKLGQMYRPDQKIPVATFRRLLRQEETQKMVSEELEKLLSDEEITHQFAIRERKEILKMAKEKQDLTNYNRALDAFWDLLDLKPSEIKQIRTTQFDWKGALDSIKKVKAERKALEDKGSNLKSLKKSELSDSK
jgi:hypothetical protein